MDSHTRWLVLARHGTRLAAGLCPLACQWVTVAVYPGALRGRPSDMSAQGLVCVTRTPPWPDPDSSRDSPFIVRFMYRPLKTTEPTYCVWSCVAWDVILNYASGFVRFEGLSMSVQDDSETITKGTVSCRWGFLLNYLSLPTPPPA